MNVTPTNGSISYSPDGGNSWIGPLSQDEFAQLQAAGIIAPEYIIRTEPNPGAPAAQAPPAPAPASSAYATSPAPAPTPTPAAAPVPPPTPTPAPEPLYYIMIGENKEGPHPKHVLLEMLSSGKISTANVVWTEGMPAWTPLGTVITPPSASWQQQATETTGNVISNVTGLGALDGFSLSRFFSEIFRNHSTEEAVDIFCAGSRMTIPNVRDINATWPTPWVFARLLLLCIVLFFGFTWGAEHYHNHPSFIVGLFLVGSFGMPFCTMVLMFELNARRDIPFYSMMKSFLVGGLFSMVIALFLFNHLKATEAYWAGPIEEPAKLLAAIMTASIFRKGSVHTGILLGCAVGAGFAAFESAAYIMNSDTPGGTMFLRAILTPCCHTVWTAITAGAFWYVMGLKVKQGIRRADDTTIDFSILWDARFLRIALIPVVLHMIWNSNLLPEYIELRWTTLGVVAWLVLLRLVQVGINQIKEEKKALVQQ